MLEHFIDFFLQRSQSKTKIDKCGRGTHGAVAWLEWAIDTALLNSGDLLLTDNEASWKTELFESTCAENNITHMYFPSNMGHLMNPCDNSFHASFKLQIQQQIADHPDLTRSEKLAIMEEAYYHLDEASIQHFFEHCGIVGGVPNQVIASLITEGNHPSSHFQKLHEEQLDVFKKEVAVTQWLDPQDPAPKDVERLSLRRLRRFLARAK